MIKKGDLVMLVRGRSCCGAGFGYGEIYTVTRIETRLNKCGYCGAIESVILAAGDNHKKSGYNIDRLKKLDPPSQGETREAYVNIDVNLKQPRKVTA